MSAISTEAFLLRSIPYREADIIAVFFTRRFGRISLLARNAKKSRKRFGGKLDYFRLLKIELKPGKRSAMGSLMNAEILCRFETLEKDLDAYWAGGHILELASLGSQENNRDEVFFNLVEASIKALEQGASPESLIRVFQAKALAALGYAFPCEKCLDCGTSLTGKKMARRLGVIKCSRCADPDDSFFSIGALHTLRAAGKLPLEKLASLKVPASINAEIGPLMEEALASALGVRLKSTCSLPW